VFVIVVVFTEPHFEWVSGLANILIIAGRGTLAGILRSFQICPGLD
jgi:hypothetical protein